MVPTKEWEEAKLEKDDCGFKIRGRNINKLHYANDTTESGKSKWSTSSNNESQGVQKNDVSMIKYKNQTNAKSTN